MREVSRPWNRGWLCRVTPDKGLKAAPAIARHRAAGHRPMDAEANPARINPALFPTPLC